MFDKIFFLGFSDAAAGESLSGVPGVVYYDAAGVSGGSRSDVGQPLSSAVGQPLSRASSKSPVGQPLSRASSQSSYEGNNFFCIVIRSIKSINKILLNFVYPIITIIRYLLIKNSTHSLTII